MCNNYTTNPEMNVAWIKDNFKRRRWFLPDEEDYAITFGARTDACTNDGARFNASRLSAICQTRPTLVPLHNDCSAC